MTKVIVLALALLGAGVLATAEKKRRKKRSMSEGLKKKPKHIVVVSRYPKEIPEEQLRLLEKKYEIAKIEVYNAETEFHAQHRKLAAQLAGKEKENRKTGNTGYQNVLQCISEQKDKIPQVLILCADTSALKISTPLLIYAAEVVHYRRDFSEEILCRALDHYSNCEKRDGK